MLDSLLGFEWDVHNVGHIALHCVAPEEVEETAKAPAHHYSGCAGKE